VNAGGDCADPASLALFGLEGAADYAARVAERLGVPLAAHEHREFEEGEHKSRPLESVRGRDVYVLQGLYAGQGRSANDRLCHLLFFLGAVRDAGAARVTVVAPYLCYARKDRRTKPRDPVTTRYVAAVLEAVGADVVVAMDVHNLAAFQNAFRCRTEHLEARLPFVEELVGRLEGPITVVSPDAGGMHRAERFREALQARAGGAVPLAFVEKHRSGGVVTGGAVVGELSGRCAVLVDDLVSSGTTLARAARACRASGAGRVMAVVTHGLFDTRAGAVLAGGDLDQVVVADTVPPRLPEAIAERWLVRVDTTPLVAEAIARLHDGGSLVELLEV